MVPAGIIPLVLFTGINESVWSLQINVEVNVPIWGVGFTVTSIVNGSPKQLLPVIGVTA